LRLTGWRLVPETRGGTVDEAFSGLGSYLYGQRWNLPGSRIVYLSEHLSLAALEVVVHTATYRELGQYRAFRAEFDEGLVSELTAGLPADWNDVEPAHAGQELGTEWARSGRSLLLRVPSAVIPHEHNYLLNVENRLFREVSIDGPLPFHFDPRLERFNRPD
jgi:RES domain-containing protein